MGKKHRYYSPEFRQQAIELLESTGQSAAAIERDLGITEGLLSRWKRKANESHQTLSHAGTSASGISAEQRIRQLERENAVLRQERDILKKTVVIFGNPKR